MVSQGPSAGALRFKMGTVVKEIKFCIGRYFVLTESLCVHSWKSIARMLCASKC